MRHRPITHFVLRTALLSGLWVVASPGPARADTPAPETYQTIVQRNPFGLRPPAPITAAAPSSEKKILPPIALTGLAARGERRWACFNLGQPGKPARSLKLVVGQRDEDVHLLSVDVAAETAEILHAGQPFHLSLKGPIANRLVAAALQDQILMQEHTRASELYQRRERLREQQELEAAGFAPKPATP